MVVDTAEKDISVVLQEVSKLALESAVNNGAKRETISITEMDSIPLQVRSFLPTFSRVLIYSPFSMSLIKSG